MTGQDEAKTVIATIKRIAPAVVTVSLTDTKTGQSETLTCTPEHPFFVTGQGWVEAGSLGIGTSIVSRAEPQLSVTNLTWHRNQGKELVAGSSGSTPGGYVVYNLTVEDDHTFFVGTTGGGTWVHNSCAFANAATKASHYGDHGSDFGAADADAYEKQASHFLDEDTDPNALTRFRANGDKVMYNQTTDEFGVMTRNNITRTYYKPDPAIHGYPTNLDYFLYGY